MTQGRRVVVFLQLCPHAKTTEGNQSCDRGKNSSSQKLIKMKNVEVASNRKSGGSEPQKTHTVNQESNPQKQM